MNAKLRAESIVDAIIHDLVGRAELQETWGAISPKIRDVIRNVWIRKTYERMDSIEVQAEASGVESDADEGLPKGLQKELLRNVGQFVPMITATFLGRYLQDIHVTLKKSAEADLVRAIVDCEVFLQKCPSSFAPVKPVQGHLERLRQLLESLDVKPEESEEEPEEERPFHTGSREVVRSDGGQHEIYNFDTKGAELGFEVEPRGSCTRLVFRRKREGLPDDTVIVWVKTSCVEVIAASLGVVE